VFNKGIVEQLGAPMELYQRPANEFVATFIGAPRINLIDRPPSEGAAAPHQALWNALVGNAAASAQRVGLRPEHLHVAAAGEGIPATVMLAEHLGDSSILHLRVDGVAELINAKIDAEHGLCEAGQEVGLVPAASWALAFDADQRLIA
jgi:multiple sugar transport system ATP-binding protein